MNSDIQSKLKHKIVKAIDEHMSGSAFQNKLQKVYECAKCNHQEQEQEQEQGQGLDGGAYGLYVKKKSRKRGGNLMPVKIRLPKPKKAGRPKVKKERVFDPESKTAKRALKVKEIMKSKGLSMIQASSYIKTNNIKY